jgi:HAD superfamily hydrolase (TIGR01484 family)
LIFSSQIKSQIKAIFSDFDDTLTHQSLFHSKTLHTLERLKEKGFWLVLVSGRPAGWADCLMRILPIDAMVFENGAGVMIREKTKIKTVRLASDKNVVEERQILQGLFDSLKKEIPHLKLATDQPYRLYDYAIDFIEEPPPLSATEIEKVLNFLNQSSGITAKLSSIHINYWYGQHTKVTACQYLLDIEGKKRSLDKNNVLYCGDSPNDEPLFQFFPESLGVANIKLFWDKLKFHPKYLTTEEGGKGFQEFAEELLT